MSKKVIHFFYDIISPYSFLGFESLTRHAVLWGPSKVDLRLRPFRLAVIMKASDNTPPMFVPNKAIYMLKDFERGAAFRGIKTTIPPNFGDFIARGDAMKEQMLFVAAVDHLTKGDWTEAVSRELYKEIFVNHVEVGKVDFAKVGTNAGLDGKTVEDCIKGIRSPEAKELLDRNNKAAIEWKAFGAPTTVAETPSGPAVFFGSDRIELLAYTLGLEYGGSLNQFSKL